MSGTLSNETFLTILINYLKQHFYRNNLKEKTQLMEENANQHSHWGLVHPVSIYH